MRGALLWVLLLQATLLLSTTTHAWIVPSRVATVTCTSRRRHTARFSSPPDKEEVDRQVNEETEVANVSFDEAGKGLMDEEDRIRMEEAGDFDSNPAVCTG